MMDVKLQEKLARLKEVVIVPEGEHPLSVTSHALSLAIREGVLYRYAQNGNRYALRWTQDGLSDLVLEHELCEVIVNKIIAVKSPLVEAEAPAALLPKKTAAPKKTGGPRKGTKKAK